MLAALPLKLAGEKHQAKLAEVLRPARLPNGAHPEQRIVVCGVSWQSYLRFDKLLGNDRPGPRLCFLEGDLEIMSTSDEHERIKTWISGFLEDFFLESELDVVARGQATMRRALRKAGAEPDASWCIGGPKKYPDLVLEVALTSGMEKLEIYRRMQVPEVWFWRRNSLEFFTIDEEGASYVKSRKSKLLPRFDPSIVERCVAMSSWREARLAFRAALQTNM